MSPLSPSVRQVSLDAAGHPDMTEAAVLDLEVDGPRGLQLIESIYGAAMASTVQSTLGARTPVPGLTLIVYAYLIANIVFQGYLLYAIDLYICSPTIAEIQRIYDDFREATHVDGVFSEARWHSWDAVEKRQLCQIPLSQPLFFVMLLVVWTSYVLIDLRETVCFACAWVNLPQPTQMRRVAQTSISQLEDVFMTDAASTAVKVFVLVSVLVPKAVIAAVLWWLGTRWLTATHSFENLVLNAAALAFITNMDEIFYTALASSEVKEATVRMQIRLRPEKCEAPRNSHRGVYVMLLWTSVNLLAPLLYVWCFQNVIPQYQWDLNRPCHSWVDDLSNNAW